MRLYTTVAIAAFAAANSPTLVAQDDDLIKQRNQQQEQLELKEMRRQNQILEQTERQQLNDEQPQPYYGYDKYGR
jgi:hypothetical protein